jgi:hypothetical protein
VTIYPIFEKRRERREKNSVSPLEERSQRKAEKRPSFSGVAREKTRSLSSERQEERQIIDVGLSRARFEQGAQPFEEMIGVVAAQIIIRIHV